MRCLSSAGRRRPTPPARRPGRSGPTVSRIPASNSSCDGFFVRPRASKSRRKLMHLGMKIALATSMSLIAVPGGVSAQTGQAAQNADKAKVLDRLNQAAANFHSTSADFEFDTIETDPIYDKDVQTGKVYYQRSGSSFKMGVHFTEHNGKPSARAYSFVDGGFKLFEAGTDTVTTYAKASKWES